jgi:hypothetical protein
MLAMDKPTGKIMSMRSRRAMNRVHSLGRHIEDRSAGQPYVAIFYANIGEIGG